MGLLPSLLNRVPDERIAEAISNAVMHRDWFLKGANIFAEIYHDRVEVVRPWCPAQGSARGAEIIRR